MNFEKINTKKEGYRLLISTFGAPSVQFQGF